MSEGYVPSAGDFRLNPRQDNRLVHIEENFVDDPAVLESRWKNMSARSDAEPGNYTRLVFRGIVSQAVLAATQSGELPGDLEAAIPIDTAGNHMIYLGENSPNRLPGVQSTPNPNVIGQTDVVDIGARVRQVVNKGFSISGRLEEASFSQLLELWEVPFGWSSIGIELLAKRLQHPTSLEDGLRNVWFAASYIGEAMVGAAMAERLTFIGPDEQPLHTVESTEWSVRPELNGQSLRRHGIMAGTLGYLHSLINRDLSFEEPHVILPYAECNATSRSIFAANAVGLRKPPSGIAPQFLRQNVVVNDGLAEHELLRNYDVVYEPGFQRHGADYQGIIDFVERRRS